MAPRAELAQRFGAGSGDLGIHAGWAVPVGVNAGASARAYPAPWLNAGLHVDGGVLFPLAGVVPGWLAWTTRLTTSTTDSRRLYGGVQVNFTQYFQRQFGSPIWIGGIVSGYEFTFGSTIAQLELVLTPLVHQPFDELSRREQPRMALDQWGLAPGPFDATATGVAQSSLFTQLNIMIYNR